VTTSEYRLSHIRGMKRHIEVSSSRRKQRKAHFTAPSHLKRKIMSSHLSKDLKKKYNVRAVPVRKDDEVLVVRGPLKGNKGKVIQVYRARWCIYIEKLTKQKLNGQPINIPIDPSKVVITKLKIDKDRNDLLARKERTLSLKMKGGKYTGKDVGMGVD
jgi:large subunit ribosomal protein L26e